MILDIANMYMYILYQRFENTILAILCIGLSIPTAIVGEWLDSLIFPDDNKSITVNGYMIIYVGTNYIPMSFDNHSFHAKQFLEMLSVVRLTDLVANCYHCIR